jgi:AraC-like DNA-binding protein
VRVATVDEMRDAPVGRYLTGSFYLAWVFSPRLIGTVYFGRPSEAEFFMLEPLFKLPGHPHLHPPYDVLVDCASLEALPPSAFEFLSRYLEVAGSFAARMRRVAIVRPPGHAGIMLAGIFHELVRASFPAALFADRAEAAVWLGHRAARVACRELDRLLDSLLGAPPEVRRLQEYLEANLRRPSLPRAAQALGVSPRSLQRALRQANTSFRKQLAHARLRSAERLLLDGDGKLESVASQLGYSTRAHFATAFRRATGERPSEFRRRRAHS